jgi:GNAT superfamily N-acetyltransferase
MAATVVNFSVERYADVIGEIKPLLEMHYEEIASFRDKIPLDPNYEKYETLDAQGILLIITARRAAQLVGYSIFFILPHLHYQSTRVASNDIIFLLPDERSGGTGIRLIRESERIVRERGAQFVSWHIKPVNDFSPLLERMGYVRHEIIMAKILED